MEVKLLRVNKYDWEIGYIAKISHGNTEYVTKPFEELIPEEGHRMIRNLWEWGHYSVFEFQTLTFYVKIPIFVARQLMRHRTFSYIEKSLRYTKPQEMNWKNEFTHPYQTSIEAYEHYINSGMNKEDARAVLPLGTMTEIIFEADARNLYNFFEQRLDKHAQHDIQNVARKMFSLLENNNKTKELAKLYKQKLIKNGIEF